MSLLIAAMAHRAKSSFKTNISAAVWRLMENVYQVGDTRCCSSPKKDLAQMLHLEVAVQARP